MRTMILSIATAVSALAIASPAAAQWAQPQGYGYQGGYHHPGHAKMLDSRIDRLQKEIKRLDKRNVLSNREADRLLQQSRQIEQRLRYVSRNGFSAVEARNIEIGIARLEQRIFRDARDGRGWNDRRYGNNQGWIDRDRDGRDDRWEDDRGTRHD